MVATVVASGADCVVAQGWEAGGHLQSDVARLPLLPRVVDAVPDTPVTVVGRRTALRLRNRFMGRWTRCGYSLRRVDDAPSLHRIPVRAGVRTAGPRPLLSGLRPATAGECEPGRRR
jgi:hypothetical protein